MIAIAHPIHVEAIGLANVRYFAPPKGAREFPWPSLDDLMAAVVMDRAMRRAFKADLANSLWADNTRKIVTSDGRTLIGQHFVAQGLIDAWATVGRCSRELYGVYAIGGAKALGKLLPDLHGDELMAYCKDALTAGGGAS